MSHPATKVLPIIAAIGLASSLALSGCSLIPHAPNSGGGGVSTNPATGGKQGGASTQSVSLPAGFPTDVPLVGTNYAYALKVSDQAFAVYVRVSNADSGFSKASDLLTGAGFTKSSLGGSGGGVNVGAFGNDKYQLEVTSSPSGEFGPIVQYVITVKS